MGFGFVHETIHENLDRFSLSCEFNCVLKQVYYYLLHPSRVCLYDQFPGQRREINRNVFLLGLVPHDQRGVGNDLIHRSVLVLQPEYFVRNHVVVQKALDLR